MLANQSGRPLVQHVVDQAARARRVRQVIVATDDVRIVSALAPFGTQCVMTSPAHQSGTDRVAEAARQLSDDVIVNVQGDEPEIDPDVIDGLISRLQHHDDDMATAATQFTTWDDIANPNMVKVVTTLTGQAMYFSRSVIPMDRDNVFSNVFLNASHATGNATINTTLTDAEAGSLPWQLHLGIYAFRRDFLLQFSGWQPTRLEQIEKLEQLRALEHGKRIYVMNVARASHGIDTPEQYKAFLERSRPTVLSV
jgi:3-deoxy-manno-octulosonate cytidylyltransferase (CMP-KDO synthetase)